MVAWSKSIGRSLILLIVLGFGGWCRRLLGFDASAPAFVFFSIFFIWGVYIAIVRKVVNQNILDIAFNGKMIRLTVGLRRIMLRDPGFVAHVVLCLDEHDENSVLGVRTHNETGSILVTARSTLLFCVLQVLWQGLFLIWHVYCICFNIRTEDWVKWKKHPDFQLYASSLPGELHVRGTNPTEGTSLVNVNGCPFYHIEQYRN